MTWQVILAGFVAVVVLLVVTHWLPRVGYHKLVTTSWLPRVGAFVVVFILTHSRHVFSKNANNDIQITNWYVTVTKGELCKHPSCKTAPMPRLHLKAQLISLVEWPLSLLSGPIVMHSVGIMQ